MSTPSLVPTLRTERLTLRAPVIADAASLARLAHDFDVLRMTTRMPFPYTLADAEGFIARAADGDPDREVNWVIDAGDGALGVLGLFTDKATAPELGYWLGRPAWGQGYATEAAQAALAWSDAVWRRPRVLATVFVDNLGSTRVLEKCGFAPTGPVHTCRSLARGGEAPAQSYVREAPV